MSPATTTPTIDVVILTWNDGDLLPAAVDSALASEDVDVRVIVVDNGSVPPAVVIDDGRVRIIRNEDNKGVAPGRDQGIAAGSAELVCLLDSDARLHPRTLAIMAAAMDEDVAMTVPVFDDQRSDESAGRAPSAATKALRGLGLTDDYRDATPFDGEHRDVDFGIGACQLFRRSAHDAAGGLDTSIFYGPEDVDFCLRLRRAGWRIVQVRNAGCFHPARRKNRRLLTKAGTNHAIVLAKHLWTNRGFAPGDPAPEHRHYNLHGRCSIEVDVSVPGADVIDEILAWSACPADNRTPPSIQVFASIDVAARHAGIARNNACHGPGFVYGDRWFATADGLILVAEREGRLVIGANRSIDRLLPTLVDWLVTTSDAGLVRSAAIALDSSAVLLTGWDDRSTMATLANLCRGHGADFIGDDVIFVTGSGDALSVPKPMVIYPHHKPFFPELFASSHKPLVPASLSPVVATTHDVVRPFVHASPSLEDWVRRVTPEHLEAPPATAMPGVTIADRARVDLMVRLERSTAEHLDIMDVSAESVADGLVTEFVVDQRARTGGPLQLAANAAGIRGLDRWLTDRRHVMTQLSSRADRIRIQLPASMSAQDASLLVSRVVRDRVS